MGEPPTHEWYWNNGRPCCVNCGTFARCEDAENTVARYIDAETRVEALEAQRDEALPLIERLASPNARSAARTEEGALIQMEVEQIAREARRILSGER